VVVLLLECRSYVRVLRTCWQERARGSARSRASQVVLTTRTLHTAYVRRSEGYNRRPVGPTTNVETCCANCTVCARTCLSSFYRDKKIK
jgi:hypothetical protein